MREDLQRPLAPERPLVGGVEAIAAAQNSLGGQSLAGQNADRDEAILHTLRQRLKDRGGNRYDTLGGAGWRKGTVGEEDKYEPQRISRKIMWQYDSNAKRVPLMRRHYI